ncbi:MAG TPA: aldo/keto reductase [Terracidiphilus sp.]|jgi:aryl-alcohol dehydrogenase-like predicted oxidoreductase
MEYRSLGNTGLKVSSLSLGASSLGGGVFRKVEEREAIRTVETALGLGINFIDVSPFYGITRAEVVLGKALANFSRDRYYLATKVGRYGENEFDFSKDRVAASVDESLKRLGVEYLDILQAHDIEYGNLEQVIEETLPALRRIQEQGKARFIGITGYPLHIFRYVLERAKIDTILSYNHYSLNDSTLVSLLPSLEERGVGVINASPLSQGLLSNRGTPVWHPASAEVKAICARAAAFCRERGSDLSKLAVQFSVINPRIATTLVGSADPANVQKNVEWLDQPLDSVLLQEVQRILRPIQDRAWIVGRAENN